MTTTTEDVVLRENGVRLFNVAQVSRALGVGRNRVYDWIESGELRTIKPGKTQYVVESELYRFLYAS